MSYRNVLLSLAVMALALVVLGLGVWVLDLLSGPASAGSLEPIVLSTTDADEMPYDSSHLTSPNSGGMEASVGGEIVTPEVIVRGHWEEEPHREGATASTPTSVWPHYSSGSNHDAPHSSGAASGSTSTTASRTMETRFDGHEEESHLGAAPQMDLAPEPAPQPAPDPAPQPGYAPHSEEGGHGMESSGGRHGG
ncbi:MAG: hypothetical protein Kow00129_16570 [Thermoleophilia bacterium]